MNKKGQISVEYLVIFTVAIALLAAMTLPMLQDSISEGKKVKSVSEANSNLNKIAGAIKMVQAEGRYAKRTVYIHSSHDNWQLVVNSPTVESLADYDYHTLSYWLGWNDQNDVPPQLYNGSGSNLSWGIMVLQGDWIGNKSIVNTDDNLDYITVKGVGKGTWEIVVVNDLSTKGRIVINNPGGEVITTPLQNKSITIHVGPPGTPT